MNFNLDFSAMGITLKDELYNELKTDFKKAFIDQVHKEHEQYTHDLITGLIKYQIKKSKNTESYIIVPIKYCLTRIKIGFVGTVKIKGWVYYV